MTVLSFWGVQEDLHFSMVCLGRASTIMGVPYLLACQTATNKRLVNLTHHVVLGISATRVHSGEV
jgi:hypothetical protein